MKKTLHPVLLAALCLMALVCCLPWATLPTAAAENDSVAAAVSAAPADHQLIIATPFMGSIYQQLDKSVLLTKNMAQSLMMLRGQSMPVHVVHYPLQNKGKSNEPAALTPNPQLNAAIDVLQKIDRGDEYAYETRLNAQISELIPQAKSTTLIYFFALSDNEQRVGQLSAFANTPGVNLYIIRLPVSDYDQELSRQFLTGMLSQDGISVPEPESDMPSAFTAVRENCSIAFANSLEECLDLYLQAMSDAAGGFASVDSSTQAFGSYQRADTAQDGTLPTITIDGLLSAGTDSLLILLNGVGEDAYLIPTTIAPPEEASDTTAIPTEAEIVNTTAAHEEAAVIDTIAAHEEAAVIDTTAVYEEAAVIDTEAAIIEEAAASNEDAAGIVDAQISSLPEASPASTSLNVELIASGSQTAVFAVSGVDSDTITFEVTGGKENLSYWYVTGVNPDSIRAELTTQMQNDNTHAKLRPVSITASLRSSKGNPTADYLRTPGSSLSCAVISADGETAVIDLLYDEASDSFTGTHAFARMGEYTLVPSLRIGSYTFGGDPAAVVVANQPPVLHYASMPDAFFDFPASTPPPIIMTISGEDPDGSADIQSWSLDRTHIPGVGTIAINESGIVTLHPLAEQTPGEAIAEGRQSVSFTVTLTDHDGASASQTYSLNLYSMREEMSRIALTTSLSPVNPVRGSEMTLTVTPAYTGGSLEHLETIMDYYANHVSITCRPVITAQNGEKTEGEPFELVWDGSSFMPQEPYIAHDKRSIVELYFDVAYRGIGPTTELNPCPPASYTIPNTDPQAAEWDVPMEAEMTGKPEEYHIPVDPNTLFTNDPGDKTTCSLTIQRDGAAMAVYTCAQDTGWQLNGNAIDGVSLQDNVLALTRKGAYTLSITCTDADNGSTSIERAITLGSRSERMRNTTLIICAIALVVIIAAIIIIRILLIRAKASFAGRTISVKAQIGTWSETTYVNLSAWGKQDVPLIWLMTCACIPPSEGLYTALSSVELVPHHDGAALRKYEGISTRGGMEKKGLLILSSGGAITLDYPGGENACITLTLDSSR